MGKFTGQQDFTGPKGTTRRNKGVLRAYRLMKRQEAEERHRSYQARKMIEKVTTTSA